ncbi:MAG: ATP-binding cassette domain-containing protein [[Clostridium] scindens]
MHCGSRRHLSTAVGNLSGGNQQKVAVAKWLASESKILILDDPRGD